MQVGRYRHQVAPARAGGRHATPTRAPRGCLGRERLRASQLLGGGRGRPAGLRVSSARPLAGAMAGDSSLLEQFGAVARALNGGAWALARHAACARAKTLR